MKRLLILSSITILCFSFGQCGDNCGEIDCAHGGICENGTCICPDGYGGDYCTQEIIPSLMKITKFEISEIPSLHEIYDGSQEPWDDSDGPDIYLELRHMKSTSDWETIYTSNTLSNVSVTGIHTIIPNNPIQVNPTDLFNIKAWDEDPELISDDHICTIGFYPYEQGKGFPQFKEIEDDDTKVKMKLYFSYFWEN